jgi:hypothetical protein
MLKERKMEVNLKRSEKERLSRLFEEGNEQREILKDKMVPINERLTILSEKEANIVKISNEKGK